MMLVDMKELVVNLNIGQHAYQHLVWHGKLSHTKHYVLAPSKREAG